MVVDKFRQFRGRRTVGKAYDGDTFDGTGEAMRHWYGGADEGDARMLDLIDQLRSIESRPDAKEQGS